MNQKIMLSCAAAMALSAVAGTTDVRYVACDDPNASGEAAVTAAQEGWTVLVKPVVYTKGGAAQPANQMNRVLIDTRISRRKTG